MWLYDIHSEQASVLRVSYEIDHLIISDLACLIGSFIGTAELGFSSISVSLLKTR